MKVVRLKEEEVQKLLNFIIVEKKFFNLQKSKEKKKDDEFSLKINTNKGGKTITFYSDGQKELIDIYNLLKNFDLSGAKPYKPEKILLSVYNVPDYMDYCTRKATIWMYNEINLENLSKEYTPHEFDKKAVDEIWDFFQKYPPDEYFYFQGDAVYGLLYRSYLRDELIRR